MIIAPLILGLGLMMSAPTEVGASVNINDITIWAGIVPRTASTEIGIEFIKNGKERWMGAEISDNLSVRFEDTRKLNYSIQFSHLSIWTGTVINDELDGSIDTETGYDYISYRNVACTKGDRIATILIFGSAEDDVIYRDDVVIGGEAHE